MVRAVVGWLRAGVGTAALLAACTTGTGREDAEVVRLRTLACERAQECNCELTHRICGGETLDDFGPGSAPPPGAFDAECLDRWVEWVQGLECESSVPRYADLCPLYFGTRYEGMPCEQSIDDVPDMLYSDCGRGLFCLQGLCRDPLSFATGTEGQPCELGQQCDEGSFCREGVCVALPAVGQECPEGRCAGDAICATDICTAPPGPGEPCLRGECNHAAYCDPVTFECAEAAAVGEPCFGHRECISGNCPAGFCEPPAGEGDGCGPQLPCGPGLRCSGNTCERREDEAGLSVSACWMLPEV